MNENPDEQDGLAHVRRLKELTGIKCADCRSCAHGHMDSDGEMGNYWECGIVCSLRGDDAPTTYAFEAGIDEDGEKPCWVPDHMHAVMSPEEKEIMDGVNDGDDYYERLGRCYKLFDARVRPHYPDPPIMPPRIIEATWLRDGWKGLAAKLEGADDLARLARVADRELVAGKRVRYMPGIRRCRVCGCNESDCRQCIEKIGHACSWVERDLCSACV